MAASVFFPKENQKAISSFIESLLDVPYVKQFLNLNKLQSVIPINKYHKEQKSNLLRLLFNYFRHFNVLIALQHFVKLSADLFSVTKYVLYMQCPIFCSCQGGFFSGFGKGRVRMRHSGNVFS